MTVLEATRDERLQLIEQLQQLAPEQWRTPSLCEGWTVHHVLAHLTTPFSVSRPAMALRFLRHRGISGAMDATARDLATPEPSALLETLRPLWNSPFISHLRVRGMVCSGTPLDVSCTPLRGRATGPAGRGEVRTWQSARS